MKIELPEVKLIKKMKGNQKGFTLTEVLIALVIFGIAGASVMFALNASSKTVVSAHEITIAESLTRTVIEYVKRSPYDSTIPYPLYDTRSTDADAVNYPTELGLGGDPYYGDYTVDVHIEHPDPEADGTDNDDGIQKITVTIYSQLDRPVLTTEAYKVNR